MGGCAMHRHASALTGRPSPHQQQRPRQLLAAGADAGDHESCRASQCSDQTPHTQSRLRRRRREGVLVEGSGGIGCGGPGGAAERDDQSSLRQRVGQTWQVLVETPAALAGLAAGFEREQVMRSTIA
jgi:hypothetical protein